MIPFALKHAWFWFALTGMVSCWFTLVIIPGRRYGGLWGRILYCVYVTWLEGAFCLGMVWHMDPHRMPHPFCVFQTLSFSLASFSLTGWAASFAIATSFAVFRPQAFDSAKAALTWHSRYIPTLIVFPLLATAAYTTFVFKLDAIRPVASDDMHCDVTDPIWVRFLGYGGLSPFVSIPFLTLSMLSAYRLYRLSDVSHPSGGDCEPTSIMTQQSYELQDKGRRRTFRLTAFFPYPMKQSTAITDDVVKPSNGKQDAIFDGVAFAMVGRSPNLTSSTPFDREKGRTPESTYSNSMPIFASNPSLPLTTIPVGHVTPASEPNSRPSHDSHIGYGVAISTEGQTVVNTFENNNAADYDEVGLAVTTDENSLRASSRRPSSEIHGAHDFPELGSLNSETIRPSVSSDSATQISIISPQQRALQSLTRYNQGPPTPTDSAPLSYSTQIPTYHCPLPSISLSIPNFASFSPQEDRHLLATSPIAPSHASIRVTQTPVSVIHLNSHNGKVYDEDGEEDEHDHDQDDDIQKGPIRTVEPRDPGERLGVYNPTPTTPTPTAIKKIERNRKKLQSKKGTRKLLAAMRRMVLFQIGFFIVQMLAALSTIIDVVHNRLSPFGTQHVALILAAWGPFVLYVICQGLPILNARS